MTKSPSCLTHRPRTAGAVAVAVVVTMCVTTICAAGTAASDDLRAAIEPLIERLDSAEYAAQVSWQEHVVLAYRSAAQRDPTALELFYLSALRDDIELSRSDVLSIALAGGRRTPSRGILERFAATLGARDFRSSEATQAVAERLGATPARELRRQAAQRFRAPSAAPFDRRDPEPDPEAGIEYEIYFGYLHAHSELSDGEGGALEAYTHARDVGELDFFALTDHGELLIVWPWENKWDELRDAAEVTYAPGSFVTLWGFEWSNPVLGHVNVINSDDFTHSLEEVGLQEIYDWIRARRRVLGRFNHPGRYDDLLSEFRHLDLYPPVRGRMAGIETFDKDDGFGEFHYDCEWLFCAGTYLDEGIENGWYLAPLGGQDNHQADWGDRNEFRTAVLAESLTREAILEAYARRRFYATEDRDLELDLRVEGFPMGSRLSAVPRLFEVTACDGDGDLFAEARLYRNGVQLETRALLGDCVETTFDDSGRIGDDAYYVIVRQADDEDGDGRGDEAISAPIWID